MMASAGRQKAAPVATPGGSRSETQAQPRGSPDIAAPAAPVLAAPDVGATTHRTRRSPASAVSDAELRPILDAACQHAFDVDRDARFPIEVLAALREARLMSALVPAPFGGRDLPLKTLVSVCEALARACASSAMMFAMHQVATACVLAQGGASRARRGLLERLASEQLLLGIADTAGADVSARAGEREPAWLDIKGEHFTLTIDGTTIPYGAYADGLLLALPPHAAVSADVEASALGDASGAMRTRHDALRSGALVAVLRDQYELDRRESWDALGMRGLCSDDFRVVAHGGIDQILPSRRGESLAMSVEPLAQLLYSAVWIGIAADALERAQACFRSRAGSGPVRGMPGTARLAEADALLQMMRAHLASALEQVARARRGTPQPGGASFAVGMDALKTGVSKSALALVNHAMMVCGIDGYRNDTDVSVARHLRDLYAAPLAIDSYRIAANPPVGAPAREPLKSVLPE